MRTTRMKTCPDVLKWNSSLHSIHNCHPEPMKLPAGSWLGRVLIPQFSIKTFTGWTLTSASHFGLPSSPYSHSLISSFPFQSSPLPAPKVPSMVKITSDASGWVVWPELCVFLCVFDLHVVFRCLRGYPITSSIWCGQPLWLVCGRGEEDERSDWESPVCIFSTGVFALLCPLGSTKENNIGKIVFRVQRAPGDPLHTSLLAGNNVHWQEK